MNNHSYLYSLANYNKPDEVYGGNPSFGAIFDDLWGVLEQSFNTLA